VLKSRPMAAQSSALRVGRYELHGEIASGGMATVYYGRLAGALGFARAVAIKRIHPHLAKDPDFVSMFADEVRLAARVQHPNVVRTLDVLVDEGEAFLVMEHLLGEALSRLLKAARQQQELVPVDVAVGVMYGILQGLHAAHEAKNERGESLHIVHRDVSPQNILVGADGVPRLIDFGVAKGVGRMQTTGEGQIKGKFGYMSPEQLVGDPLDRRSDIYSAGVVLWELLAGRRMIAGENNLQVFREALEHEVGPPSTHSKKVSAGLDLVVMKALAREPERRFSTARQMAMALEEAGRVAGASQLAAWVEELAGPRLVERSRLVGEIERGRSTEPDAKSEVVAVSGVVGPHTVVSTIVSTSRSIEAALAPRRRARFVMVGVAAAVGVVGVFALASLHHRGYTATAATPGAGAPSAPPQASVSSVAPVAPAPPSATPLASVASAPPSSPPAAPVLRAPAASGKASRAPATRAPQPAGREPPAKTPGNGCRVEQYMDSDGFVRFRCAS
jgi:serine/threonine protein kinase